MYGDTAEKVAGLILFQLLFKKNLIYDNQLHNITNSDIGNGMRFERRIFGY